VIPRLFAPRSGDRVTQSTRFRVHSMVSGNDSVGVGDLVFVKRPDQCPSGSIGFIRELGADCSGGSLIARIDLCKSDPMSWPTAELWAYPDDLWKVFGERWHAGVAIAGSQT
jgi:hypothetical protein